MDKYVKVIYNIVRINLRKPKFPRLKKVVVHYIGHEGSMNFGLNAIFGSVAELSFSINDINASKKVPSVKDLEEYDDIFTPEFISFLCSRVTDLKTTNFEAFDRLRKKLIAKLEKKHKETDESKPISAKEYFNKGDGSGLEKAIKEKLFGAPHTEFQQWKNKILSCFDKCAAIKIADTRGKTKFKSNVLTKANVVKGYTFDDREIVVEDSITFENIDEGKICLLLKFNQPALFKCDSKFAKNPMLIFHDEEVRSQMIKRFELQPLSINSVKQLVQGSDIVSPFTRDLCKAFILGPSNMNEIDFQFPSFGVVSSKLVDLYLIKTHIDSTVKKDESVAWPRDELHPLVNAVLKEYVLNDNLLYHLTLHVRIALPVDRVPLYVALWYIILVAPMYAPNSTRNLLRYPGATILLDLYKDANLQDKIPLDDTISKRLNFRIKLWKLWNRMLGHKKDKELDLIIRANYQNYCIVLDKIVLLSGRRPAELPAPDLVSGIPPSVFKNMWNSLTPKSTRFAKINSRRKRSEGNSPQVGDFEERQSRMPRSIPMKIDPNTLRPYVTCPVTNKPASECAGKYSMSSPNRTPGFSPCIAPSTKNILKMLIN
ncbi:hypothetical protein U1Q18_048670 [Sarracenia purpurea var. burkii]